ncbi:hypothetical protein H6G00_00435 [Leptolyngbya sp. FACHB-541]|uniref:hypothetical protein n=1 Tax=Leptolyngbya sp. FACHB-541 TaxID=2692810 RepID=UPI001689D9A1|nr:hypothetical protein [Leptolyngbya sp. FACHB-541]MBD1995095.1 hypothetical protein [Leptolyngbya sp. FACHB-541]
MINSITPYTATQNHRQTSATAAGLSSVQPPPQINSATFAALFIALSTSVSSPSAITPFRSATANPIVKRSILPIKETDRADLLAIARIRVLGTYKAGWTGPESVGPTRQTVEHAEEFARYLFSLGAIHVPYISASEDGEINFYWKRDGFTLDLGFTGNGCYSYYACLPAGEEMIEDEAVLGTPLPKEIVNLIVQAV